MERPAAAGPIYRLTFGDLTLGTAEITVPASASDTEIATAIHNHLLADGYGVVTVDVDLAAERAEVYDAQGRAFGTVTIAPAPDPDDYWVKLAADLHQAAERTATLAGTMPAPRWVKLDFTVTTPGNTDLGTVSVVDAVASAFDTTPRMHPLSRGERVYQADLDLGTLRVQVSTYLPAELPEPSELERLRAELAEAKAALAATQPALITGDPANKPGEVRHIRQIGAYRANLCSVEGGNGTWPSNATCEDCKAAHDKAHAAGEVR